MGLTFVFEILFSSTSNSSMTISQCDFSGVVLGRSIISVGSVTGAWFLRVNFSGQNFSTCPGFLQLMQIIESRLGHFLVGWSVFCNESLEQIPQVYASIFKSYFWLLLTDAMLFLAHFSLCLQNSRQFTCTYGRYVSASSSANHVCSSVNYPLGFLAGLAAPCVRGVRVLFPRPLDHQICRQSYGNTGGAGAIFLSKILKSIYLVEGLW